MKNQQVIDATAKKYYFDEGDRKKPVYFFTAKAKKIFVNYIFDQRLIEHIYTDLFFFYEADIIQATKEFYRRLASCDLDITVTEVELKYRTVEDFIIPTGVKVQL